MKTLYININTEPVSSSEDWVVMDYDLMGDFFFYLGERIGKGCKIQNENALITDFNTPENKQDYDLILSQWNEVRRLLFSEEVTGSFNFELPSGYLHWLHYNEDYNHVYEANFSNGGSKSVTIDLEELFEDSVEALQRKIMRKLNRDDLYHEIDEIVFNDENVSHKSKIVRAIKAKYDNIGFKAYKKWLQEIGDKAIMAPQVSERSKNNPNECNKPESADDFFPYKGIVLGKTSMKKFDHDLIENKDMVRYDLDVVNFLGIKDRDYFTASICDSNLPQKWSRLLGCRFGTSRKKCLSALNEKKYEIIFNDKVQLVAVSPNKKYRTHLIFNEYETAPKFATFVIMLNECPYCKSNNLSLRQYDQEGLYLSYCSDCNKFYFPEDNENDESEEIDNNEIPCCPECYSDDVEDDGSDYLQYTCNDCGHNWGHDDTVECPECGSDDVENNGTDYLQYTCNECGHMWGDEDGYEGEEEVNEAKEECHYGELDNAGHQMSEYLEVSGVILGKSTKSDLVILGGRPWEDYPNQYWMPKRFNVYLKDNIVERIEFLEESIPTFYRSLGIRWGMNREEFDEIFRGLGFRVSSNDSYCSAYGFCYKYLTSFCVSLSPTFPKSFHISIV